MLHIDDSLQPQALEAAFHKFWELSAAKITLIDRAADSCKGAPVFTKDGRYTSRGWTDWTQGFQFGAAILQFDATGDQSFLQLGREQTVKLMTPHLTHFGVHDHGFNNVSTYGNLWRLMNEGKIAENPWERAFYEMALKCSGAVQAKRWTALQNGAGFIYSFNGPHSLFIDTIRTLRSLALAHMLGHVGKDENDRGVSLLARLLTHLKTTAQYAIYYGEGRDAYDVRGRVAHESIFNINDGNYRCPNSQQGFSPFTTWTRGLAWAILGFAEELEFLSRLNAAELEPLGGWRDLESCILKAAQATADFYLANTPTDGIPYWDTGAPCLHQLGDYLARPADPFNAFEPVDSSAAAIAAQGLLRLGYYLQQDLGSPPLNPPVNGGRFAEARTISSPRLRGDKGGWCVSPVQQRDAASQGQTYWQAGLTVVKTLLAAPYLSTKPQHQGLILHSVYHRPNGWDHIPPGQKIPCGEATMWGDYHAREIVLYLQRIIRQEPYLTFLGYLKHL